MKLMSHYTNLNTLINHILPSSRFLLNILPNMNDPYEYKKRFSMVMSKYDFTNTLPDAPFIVDDVIHLQTKIGSFVKETGNLNDIQTLSSITNSAMWANY
jgi:uncharacterized membrane protein